METGEGRKEAETRALIPFFFFSSRPSLLLYFSRRLEACGPASLVLRQTESHWSVL